MSKSFTKINPDLSLLSDMWCVLYSWDRTSVDSELLRAVQNYYG
jgi:hypothetical protein